MKKILTILMVVVAFACKGQSVVVWTGSLTPDSTAKTNESNTFNANQVIKGSLTTNNGSDNTAILGGTGGMELFNGATVWNDYVVPATQTRVTPSTSKPTLNLDSIALEFVRDADSNEICYFSVQIPHSVRYGADVVCYPHFHFMQYAAADTTYQMTLWYRIHKLGSNSGNWTRIIPSNRASLTFVAAPFHNICGFPAVALVNVNESSVIDFKLYRRDNAGNPATLWFKQFDIHFELNKLGTPNEYPNH